MYEFMSNMFSIYKAKYVKLLQRYKIIIKIKN